MSDDNDFEGDDEVREIKRAMREARARKRTLDSKLKTQWRQDHEERQEMESVVQKSRNELDNCRKKLTDCEFDLREAKYEITQLMTQVQKLEDERNLMQTVHQSQILEIRLKSESALKSSEEKHHLISLESQKVIKLLDKFISSSESSIGGGGGAMMKTQQHILDKLVTGISKIQQINTGSSSNQYAHVKFDQNKNGKSVDAAVDSAMLDMCRSLEEENASLSENVHALREELADAKREAASSQLIPHYRLAIIRARTYAANLLEQVQREQQTSEDLRKQLQEQYEDLKKVAEEKRQLYKKIGKHVLQAEEDHYRHDILDRQREEELSYRTRRAPSPSLSRSTERKVSPPPQRHREHHDEDLEGILQRDVKGLDINIESLVERLGEVALARSQKILNHVMQSSDHKLHRAIE